MSINSQQATELAWTVREFVRALAEVDDYDALERAEERGRKILADIGNPFNKELDAKVDRIPEEPYYRKIQLVLWHDVWLNDLWKRFITIDRTSLSNMQRSSPFRSTAAGRLAILEKRQSLFNELTRIYGNETAVYAEYAKRA